MSTDKKDERDDLEETSGAASESEATERPNEEASAPEEASSESEVESLNQRVGELQDQILRTQAEMQNVRRRAETEVEKARKFALEKFVKELLPVVDSLEKAVESANAAEPSLELVASMKQGSEMTLSMLVSSLGKFKVEAIDPVGEPFNPQLHEAMSMVPAPDAEPNSVVAVVQKGYQLNERLVRPAMVVVARAEEPPVVDEKA